MLNDLIWKEHRAGPGAPRTAVDRHTDWAALYMSGVPVKAIAERAGVKPPAVTRALNAQGIKLVRKQKTTTLVDDLAELVANGLSVAQASMQLRISQQRGSQLWRRIVTGLGWQAIL